MLEFKFKGLGFIIILGVLCSSLKAQNDTLLLNTIEVYDSVRSEQKASLSFEFDSVQYNQFSYTDAGDFLQKNTSIYVKDYGPGSTSSLSYRGGSAYHTKIYWEGIPIDNVMLGQTDISLFPTGNFGKMQFLKSGNSLSMGSGGFGGILNFNLGSDEWKGFSAEASNYIGSYGQQGGAYSLMLGNGKIKLESFLSLDKSENNFLYEDYINNDGMKERENASFQKIQFIPKLSLKLNKNHAISLIYWMNNADRQVPTTIGSQHGNAEQLDDWKRLMLKWQYVSTRVKMNFKSTLVREDMLYLNPSLGINSINRIDASKSLLDLTYRFNGKLSNEIQLKNEFYKIETNNYLEMVHANNFGFFEGLYYDLERYFLHGILRYEYWDTENQALMPSIYTGIRPFETQKLTLFTNLSYNVRFPSFNELYWQGLGNLNLKREEARTAELGVEHKHKKSRHFHNSYKISAFYSLVENLITWTPDEYGFWTPVNNKSVRNQGFEIEDKFEIKVKKWKTTFIINYAYTSSVLVDNEANYKSENKQQIYIPEHKLNGFVVAEYHGYYLSYSQVFTSDIYTSSDNESFIPFSMPANAEFGKKIKAFKSLFDLRFSVSNLFNEHYQYVSNMPMPLRNYQISIKYHFN